MKDAIQLSRQELSAPMNTLHQRIATLEDELNNLRSIVPSSAQLSAVVAASAQATMQALLTVLNPTPSRPK